MTDHELLATLQSLGEVARDGFTTPHHVTMLQLPRPAEAQLNGLAEISALVATVVQTGWPMAGDWTRSFAGHIIIHSRVRLSNAVSTVTGEVTDLERWRRRVDDDGTYEQGEPIEGTHFIKGLGVVTA